MATYRLKNVTPEKLEELAKISHNLRHYSKIWKQHYGATNRNQMKVWEDKMDEWLQDNVDYEPITNLENYYGAFSANWADTSK